MKIHEQSQVRAMSKSQCYVASTKAISLAYLSGARPPVWCQKWGNLGEGAKYPELSGLEPPPREIESYRQNLLGQREML